MESASATGEIELSIESESETQAAAGWSRWYVVTVLGLVYAMNIADRYVVSTLMEPIRLDLHLTDPALPC